jgi:hypothetical protein
MGPERLYMAHTFLPPKVFANAGLKLLKNNLVMAKLCDSRRRRQGVQARSRWHRLRQASARVHVRTGATASNQDVVEGEVAVTIDTQKGVDVQFTSQEATLNVDALLKDKVLNASMAQIASKIDGDLIARVSSCQLGRHSGHHDVGSVRTVRSGSAHGRNGNPDG